MLDATSCGACMADGRVVCGPGSSGEIFAICVIFRKGDYFKSFLESPTPVRQQSSDRARVCVHAACDAGVCTATQFPGLDLSIRYLISTCQIRRTLGSIHFDMHG